MDEKSQRFKQSRSYCLERLAEVKEEIAKFQEEGLALKARLETAPDATAQGRIRSRRRFLSRRLDELKGERSALTKELEEANAQLNIPIARIARDGHNSAPQESALSAREEYELPEFSEGRPAPA